jgi:hypothetical protein
MRDEHRNVRDETKSNKIEQSSNSQINSDGNTDWDKIFYSQLDECLEHTKSLEETFRMNFKLYKILGMFREKAMEVAAEIIDELYFPLPLRRFRPLNVEDLRELRIPDPSRIFFQEFCYEDKRNSLIIRITFSEYGPIEGKSFKQENKQIYSKSPNQKYLVYQEEHMNSLNQGKNLFLA